MNGYLIIKAVIDKKKFRDDLDDMKEDTKIDELVEKIKGKFSKIGDAFADALKKGGKGLKGLGTKIVSLGKVASGVIASVIKGTIKWGAILTASLGVVALLGLLFLGV